MSEELSTPALLTYVARYAYLLERPQCLRVLELIVLAAGEGAARYCTPRARGTEVDLDLLATEHPAALRQVYGVVRSHHDRLNRPAV